MENQSGLYTLDEGLAAVEFGKFQRLLLGYAGLGFCVEAMGVMSLSFIGPALKSEWHLSSSEESLLTTVVFGGMLIGTYSWGLISDKYGRKKGLLGMILLTPVAGVFSSFAPNYIYLLVFRFMVGVGLSCGTIYFTWFLEFLPVLNRGKLMIVASIFWTVGTIAEAALAWAVMPRLSWRWLLALSSVPSIVLLLFYGSVPESPRYLCMKGRSNDAQRILEKIAICNGTNAPSGMLICDGTSRSRQDDEFTLTEETPLLPLPGKAAEGTKGFSLTFMLFSTKLIKTTLTLWALFFGTSFWYYGVILLTSELSSRDTRCNSRHSLLGNSQNPNMYLDVFITNFGELPGLALAAMLVDRVGRKISLEIMYGLGLILLLPLVSHQSEILTTALLFGSRMCANGAFTICSIYAPELYPTSMRATGATAANAIGRIGGMVCPIVAVALVSGCEQIAAVIFFELFIVFSALCTLLIKFETKGRELSDTLSPSDEDY